MANINQQIANQSDSNASQPSRKAQQFAKYQQEAYNMDVQRFNENKARAEAIRQDIFETNKENLTLEYYKQKYESLSPELKPFFVTPEELAKDPSFQKFQQERQAYADNQEEVNAYKRAYEYYTSGKRALSLIGTKAYKYYQELRKNYGSYREMEKEKIKQIETRNTFGEGGTFTEFNIINGKEMPVSQTVYIKGQAYKYDISKLPASEKLVYNQKGEIAGVQVSIKV